MNKKLMCDYMDGIIIEKISETKLRCIFTYKILENYNINSIDLFKIDEPKIKDFYNLVLKRAREDLNINPNFKNMGIKLQNSNPNSIIIFINDVDRDEDLISGKEIIAPDQKLQQSLFYEM